MEVAMSEKCSCEKCAELARFWRIVLALNGLVSVGGGGEEK
jgi:hypothetical protein